ncbi:MAG: ABC transporter transmembrane domain-containing protein, partial [Calditrichaceae bacterium]
MKFDRRLLKFLSEVRFPLFLTIFLGLSAGILTIGQAKYISMIIDDVFLKGIGLPGVSGLLFIFAVISILRAFFIWFSQSESNRIALYIKARLRKKLGEKILNAGPSYVTGERSGELSNTILNGVEALDAYFSKYIPQLFLSVLIPVASLFFIFPADLLSGV